MKRSGIKRHDPQRVAFPDRSAGKPKNKLRKGGKK